MGSRIYLLLAALLLCSIQLQAQSVANMAQSNESLEQHVNGIVATFSPFAEGRATTEGILRAYKPLDDDEKTIGCFLINPSTGMYIGYLLAIERLPEPTKLKITIKPMPFVFDEKMNETAISKLLELKLPTKTKRGYTPSSPPSYPEPIVINITDVIKIPLWVNAGTEWGVIGDQIRFAVATNRPKPARDFTLDDVALKFTHYRLIINGVVRSGESELDDIEGPLPSFHLPGKGLFILSIRPHEGHDFQKIGVAEGNKISFSYGGDKYEWVSREPVIAQGGVWSIWVLLVTDYQPDPGLVEYYKLISKGNCCTFSDTMLGDASKPPSYKK